MYRNKPHKHADLIKEWANGAEIETFSKRNKCWITAKKPTWDVRSEYRIKPRFIFAERRIVIHQDTGVLNAKADNPNVRFCFDSDGTLLSVEKLERK